MFAPEFLRANVPPCLRQLRRWVCWKYIKREGKPTKCPINPRTGKKASTTDPTTWGTFDQAVAACQRRTNLDGVGFVFTSDDPFVGVDLDNCLDPTIRQIKSWAQSIIRRLNTYSEISPSGMGVKLFVRCRKNGKRCKAGYEDGAVEMYDSGRFFTVTGQRLPDTPVDVEKRQAELDAVYEQVFGNHPSPQLPSTPRDERRHDRRLPLDDDEIIRLATHSKHNGSKFADLWAGRWNGHFNSQSEADSSFVFRLAFYSKDAAQIDRIFRRSGLMRAKWDERHGQQTYGAMTIAKALEHVTEQYRSKRSFTMPSPRPDGGPPDSLPPLYQYDEVARCFLEANSRMIYWRGVFHMYSGTCYRILAEAELGARVTRFITDVGWWCRPARKRSNGEYGEGAVPHPEYNGLMVTLEKVVPSTHDVREIILQFKRDFLADTLEAPRWLDNRESPTPDELFGCRNRLLHLPTGIVHPHCELFFSLNVVGYDYDPAAPAAVEWLKFLNELFEDDVQAIETLQELFGYFLLPDTRQHKIALVVGPKRGGKGTIGRVLTGLAGRENVCAPTLGSLGTNFGLWPLLHKRLAIITDARLSGRTDQAVVVERLLSISGEDTVTADRKHLAPWTGRLQTRFLIMTNELPRLIDVSGALAGRFIVLRLTKSWYGREDHGLTDRLLGELPGILNWSIEGWRRLKERGYFVQPESSLEMMQDIENLSSPIKAFVRECCNVETGLHVEVEALYTAWREYCGVTGRKETGTIQTFGRDLGAAFPCVRVTRPRFKGARVRCYEGISLRPDDTLVRDGPRSLPLHA